DWDGTKGVREQQVVTISNAVSGTFKLSFRGYFTVAIPHNAPASRIASALTELATVGMVEVTKEVTAGIDTSVTSTWRVVFIANVGDQPLMAIQATSLRGINIGTTVLEAVKGTGPSFDQGTVGINVKPLESAEVTPVAEVQTITVVAGADDLGGYYFVGFEGHWSEKIDWDADKSAMTTALMGIPTLGAVEVSSSSATQVHPSFPYSAGPAAHGTTWAVTFPTSAGDAPSMVVSTKTGLETTLATSG
ncbi:unnamed protein product, partial [Choristocarpus tenellus]